MSKTEIPQNPFYEEYIKNPEHPEHKEAFQYNHELAFIGDTNGDFFGFLKNILSLRYVEIKMDGEKMTEKIILNYSIEEILTDGEVQWLAGDAHLVQVGDVLGDRQGEGDSILTFLSKIRVLAQEKSGDVIVNLGNHDMAALLYLVYGQTRGVIDIHPCPLDEYLGFSYDTNEINVFGSPEICFDRESLYRDQNFVKHIQEIKENYKIIHVENETLFLHADVNPVAFIHLFTKYREIMSRSGASHGGNASLLLLDVAEYMQADFRKGLDTLFPEKTELGRTFIEFIPEEKRYQIAQELFSDEGFVGILSGFDGKRFFGNIKAGEYPSDYSVYPKAFIDFLRMHGIQRIVFGHTQHTLQIYDDFQVISADGRSTSLNQKYSSGKIGKDGTLEYNVSPRTVEDAKQEKNRMKKRAV